MLGTGSIPGNALQGPFHVYAKSFQSCLTLCDLMDCSPPGATVHGILQARILMWIAMPSSVDIPDPGIELMWTYSVNMIIQYFLFLIVAGEAQKLIIFK